MSESDPKQTLHRYLQYGRDALLWKLEGLPEFDIRRPLMPTGTNLLGLVKHLAYVEAAYFGQVFGRPYDAAVQIDDADEPNCDMWATASETREQIADAYRQVWAHSDTTIRELPLDAAGRVSWWPEDQNPVTLHWILVHVATETHRHAGHADIVRELVDGAAGFRKDSPNLPDLGQTWWVEYRGKLERVAQEVSAHQ
jgi:uncharacterized damage-inducible protein DinB